MLTEQLFKAVDAIFGETTAITLSLLNLQGWITGKFIEVNISNSEVT